jgi:CRISPR-associated protein Cst2
MIQSLSFCAQITMDLHNLNSEGTEGNQQQTRMVHIVDDQGERQNVNAVSGDMFKHILVEHLTPLLEAAGEPLSSGAREHNPDRVNVDPDFEKAIAEMKASTPILREIIRRCAVTDIAGALVTAGSRAVARKSCIEFGWVVGIPEKTHTEQYFHVKYAPETRAKTTGQERGEGTVAGKQAIFHRPANSGIYAIICHLELGRIGVNDVSRESEIEPEARQKRARAAVQALMATLIKPAGAQRNTQNPHIVDCRGVIATSTSHLPAPLVSPLNPRFVEQMESISGTLNELQAGSVSTVAFESLAGAVQSLKSVAEQV